MRIRVLFAGIIYNQLGKKGVQYYPGNCTLIYLQSIRKCLCWFRDLRKTWTSPRILSGYTLGKSFFFSSFVLFFSLKYSDTCDVFHLEEIWSICTAFAEVAVILQALSRDTPVRHQALQVLAWCRQRSAPKTYLEALSVEQIESITVDGLLQEKKIFWALIKTVIRLLYSRNLRLRLLRLC